MPQPSTRRRLSSLALRGVLAGALTLVGLACSLDATQAPTPAASAEARSLRLRVVDNGSREGLAHADVSLVDGAHAVLAHARADRDGLVTLQVPASGKLSITAAKRGYSLGVTGVVDGKLPDGEVILAVDPLQAVTSSDTSRAPGNAAVDTEIGRSVIPTSGSTTTTVFHFQGPKIDAEHYSVPLFGAAGAAYRVGEVDAITLAPLPAGARVAHVPDDGVLVHELSAEGRAAAGGAGVLLTVTRLDDEPTQKAPPAAGDGTKPAMITVPVGSGSTVTVGQGVPDTCGPAGSTCIQFSQTTGNVQTFCPPATNPPYCTVSFTASVGVTVGVGVEISGSVSVGAGINVYPTGYGTFECKVKGTACAWAQPGHYVATQTWGLCRPPYSPFAYPCWKTVQVWVPDPCGGGGIDYPNLGLSSGMCTCFNWSAVMDKIKECPMDGGADARAEGGSR